MNDRDDLATRLAALIEEQDRLLQFIRQEQTQFAQQAKAHGYTSFMTPAVSLMNVAGAECAAQTGEALEDAFIRCNVTGKAAVADVVNIQWQRLESTPAQYASYAPTSAGQAKAVNPQVIFLTQLTARTFATQATPTTGCLIYAYSAARPCRDSGSMRMPLMDRLGSTF